VEGQNRPRTNRARRNNQNGLKELDKLTKSWKGHGLEEGYCSEAHRRRALSVYITALVKKKNKTGFSFKYNRLKPKNLEKRLNISS
jgi:hypothetical protein